MKKVSLFIIIISFINISSCNLSKNKVDNTDYQIQSIGKNFINEQIKSFLTDFFSEVHNDSCIYELYVDKKERDEYQLSLLCKNADNKYFKENFPVNYITIKGKIIFIYSGVEDFINKDTYCTKFKYNNQGESKYICAWYKYVFKDTSYIIKSNTNIITPFCKATLKGVEEFEPPLSP